MSKKKEPKYPIGGYAPGYYTCNCCTCKTQFQVDKRAVQCEPCAIKMIQEQNIIDMMKGDEELGLYDEIQPEQIWNEEKNKGIKQLIQDHKQETLEEAAERIGNNFEDSTFKAGVIYGVIEGAKWQSERSYSEEEVLSSRLFKPIAVDYNLGSVNGFDRVNIGMKNNKYLISFYMSGKYGGETFFEIKDAIIGGMGFLANENDINKYFTFYESYDECIEVLKNRNLKNLTSDFDKFKIDKSRFLLAIKTQTLI